MQLRWTSLTRSAQALLQAPHRRMSFKDAIGRAVEWRIFSVLIDLGAACAVSWHTGKPFIWFSFFGTLSLLRLGANIGWLKLRGGVKK